MTCETMASPSKTGAMEAPISDTRSLAQSLLNNKELVVNSDKLVAKIATYISDNGGERNIPVGVLLQLTKDCSQTKSAAASAGPSPVTTNPSRTEPPKWHCQPLVRDDTYQRKRQKITKTLREKLLELTGGNLNMALDICQNLEANLRYSIRTDKILQLALAITTGTLVPQQQPRDTSAIDKIIVDNIREYLALGAHQNGGGRRKDTLQHMLDAILCAVSPSSISTNSISTRKLAERLGMQNHTAFVKAKRDRDEVMVASHESGTHKFCEPVKKQKRCDAGMKRPPSKPAILLQDVEAAEEKNDEEAATAARLK